MSSSPRFVKMYAEECTYFYGHFLQAAFSQKSFSGVAYVFSTTKITISNMSITVKLPEFSCRGKHPLVYEEKKKVKTCSNQQSGLVKILSAF